MLKSIDSAVEIGVLFENSRFLAVEKPYGWLTVPARKGDADPRPCLSRRLGSSIPVHRLDVEVSGIVLFAKDAEAHREANCWFEGREIHKHYEAWTDGEPPAENRFEMSSKLLRGKKRAYQSEHGKFSVTRVHFAGSVEFRKISVLSWNLEPLTGRSHQLRAHMAAAGHPILGDALYGSKNEFVRGAIALRAVKLDFSRCAGAGKLGLPDEIRAAGLREVFTNA